MASLGESLLEKLRRVSQIQGAISIPTSGETAAHTIPLLPGLSLATVPSDRDLTPEERRHESVHALGGLPLAATGTVVSKLLGVTQGGMPHAYLAPDEVLSYFLQPQSDATREDMKTIGTLAGKFEPHNVPGEGYLALVKALSEKFAR